ncbi:MAG: hypothetical protein WBD20_20080, partial [Pirellulaceae bacterium]
MQLIHHLARTGGTLLARCLGSMDGVCLLSEISPTGTAQFNPLRQAADWYGLISDDEICDLPGDDPAAFAQAMNLIASRANENGLSLIVRDWSHLDWVGFPFVSPPMKSSWSDLGRIATEGDGGDASRDSAELFSPAIATVRHPIDQYRSTRRLPMLGEAWDDDAFWRGTRAFAESIQQMPWFRYEDFLAAPATTLQQMCDAMSVRYDPAWQQRWADYDKVTGDGINRSRTQIRPVERKPLERGFWRELKGNSNLFATLDLLGYPTPEPLRRKWFHAG